MSFFEIFGQAQTLGVMVVGALFLFTLVVFIHELGHFLVARWCGVGIDAFSIGFGPEIFGWNDGHGTRWKFCWLPLGGYVKFIDDADVASGRQLSPDELEQREAAARQMQSEPGDGGAAALKVDPERTFAGKTVLQRSAIVAAGPIANFLLAIVIFWAMFFVSGEREMSARVDAVAEGSAAAEAGFQPGDAIVGINGTAISQWDELLQRVGFSAGIPMEFTVLREGARIQLSATPRATQTTDLLGNAVCVGRLGIQRNLTPADNEVRSVGPVRALQLAGEQTWDVVATTGRVVGNLFVSSATCPAPIGGPIKVAQTAAQAANLGFVFLINVAAFISISLGLVNLLPIPVLDGGHLLFYAIEAIRGQPLDERIQEVGFRIGLGLILMLMVAVTFKDSLELLN